MVTATKRKATARKRTPRRAPSPDAEAEEESLESIAFQDALLNGDEKVNRLVKLIDTRFAAHGKRTREVRDEVRGLRADLAPLLWIVKAGPIVLSALGAAALVLGIVDRLGLLP
jgi:hypothetical protein